MAKCQILPSGMLLLILAIFFAGNCDARWIEKRKSDTVVVFVHGFLGDAKSTWTNTETGSYWPELLSQDPQLRSVAIYVASIQSRFLGRQPSIDELSEQLRLKFDADGVTDYKWIVFISHSMGGLVVRSLLNKYRHVAARTKFAYFYGTPTTGSAIANLGKIASDNVQLKALATLTSDSYLADLQRSWLAANGAIPSFCAYEMKDSAAGRIVDQTSATNLCNQRLDPIFATHVDMVKPRDSSDEAYIAFLSAWKQIFGLQNQAKLSGNKLSTAAEKNPPADAKKNADLAVNKKAVQIDTNKQSATANTNSSTRANTTSVITVTGEVAAQPINCDKLRANFAALSKVALGEGVGRSRSSVTVSSSARSAAKINILGMSEAINNDKTLKAISDQAESMWTSEPISAALGYGQSVIETSCGRKDEKMPAEVAAKPIVEQCASATRILAALNALKDSTDAETILTPKGHLVSTFNQLLDEAKSEFQTDSFVPKLGKAHEYLWFAETKKYLLYDIDVLTRRLVSISEKCNTVSK